MLSSVHTGGRPTVSDGRQARILLARQTMSLVRLRTKQYLQHVISSKVMDNPLLHAAAVSRNDRWVLTT